MCAQHSGRVILAIDVGNTNTEMGLVAGGAVLASFRLETRRNRTYDEYRVFLGTALRLEGLEELKPERVVVSSVVPPALLSLRRLALGLTGSEPLVVDHRMRTGLKLKYHRPEEMGADRIVNAAYCYKHFGECIVVDFGTATTFDVVNINGEYLGGTISPGINISMDALFHNASRLPRVDVSRPERVVGRTTEEAMRSGVYFGYVSMVDGMVRRIREETGIGGPCLATGGLAGLIAGDSHEIDREIPDLALLGLAWLYDLNNREGENG